MSDGSIDFDTILDLCRHRYRRIMLAVLIEERRSLTVQDLTKTILKHNHDTPLQAVSEKVLAHIRISLHHDHIPRLEQVGIIEYDAERHIVELTDSFDQVESIVSAIITLDPALERPVEL